MTVGIQTVSVANKSVGPWGGDLDIGDYMGRGYFRGGLLGACASCESVFKGGLGSDLGSLGAAPPPLLELDPPAAGQTLTVVGNADGTTTNTYAPTPDWTSELPSYGIGAVVGAALVLVTPLLFRRAVQHPTVQRYTQSVQAQTDRARQAVRDQRDRYERVKRAWKGDNREMSTAPGPLTGLFLKPRHKKHHRR